MHEEFTGLLTGTLEEEGEEIAKRNNRRSEQQHIRHNHHQVRPSVSRRSCIRN
jgi:hypothetical protein